MKILGLSFGGAAFVGAVLLASGASAAPIMATGLSAAEVTPDKVIVQTQGRRFAPRAVGPRRGVVVRRGGRGVGLGAAAVGLGVLGAAVAIGAANSAPRECWIERRPVTDRWGNYIGDRNVRVCN